MMATFRSMSGLKCSAAITVLAIAAYLLGIATSSLLCVFFKCKESAFKFRSESFMFAKTMQFSRGLQSHASVPDWGFSDLVLFQTQCSDPLPSEKVRTILLDKIFNGVSPFDGFPPEHIKPLLKGKRIKGWGSYGVVFDILMREVRPTVVIELGSFLGASAIHMANLSRDLQLNTLFLCVDDYRGWPGFREKFKDVKMVNGNVMLLNQFLQNVAVTNFTESVLPLPFSTASMLKKLCEWGVYADLIEVDAGHDFHSAWYDINAAYAVLKPGGVLFGHDYFTKMDNKGVRRAVDLFAKNKRLRVEPNGQHWILRND
eukprot:c24613_g2_i1 orf=185-1129(+)